MAADVEVPAVVVAVVVTAPVVVAAADVVEADRDVVVVGFAVGGADGSLRGHTAKTSAPRMATSASAASTQGQRDSGVATCTGRSATADG